MTGKNFLKQRSKPALVVLLLFLTGIVYFPALGHDFLSWDDPAFLLHNTALRVLTWGNVKNIFSSPVESVYVPLTIMSFALEHYFLKFKPWIYHLNNILLHLAVVALVFVFAVRIGLPLRAGFLAALLFGIHPMHVESVVWITERKDVLYAVFYMAALISYWKYLENKRAADLVWTTLWGILSMLSKPMALSLPLILLLCDWLKKRKFSASVIVEKIPLTLVIACLGWITYSYYRRVPGQDFLEAGLIGLWTMTFYVRQFLVPVILNPFYALPRPITFFSLEYFTAACVLGVMIFGLIRYRKEPWLSFAVLFYLGSIFFLFRLDTAADRNIVADRFMYLPCLGFCFFIGEAFDKLLKLHMRHYKILVLMAVGCYLLLGVRTMVQVGIWKNDDTFWNHVLFLNPDNPIAYNHRAMMYEEKKDLLKALKDYDKAISLEPNYLEAFNNRGLVYSKFRRYDLALRDFNTVMQIDPLSETGFFNRGYLYFRQREYDLALKDYTRAIALRPRYAEAYNARGSVYEAMKQYPEALSDYHRAIVCNPFLAEAYNNRGVVYAKQKFTDYALADFAKALEITPDNARAYWNRSLLYSDMKDYSKALDNALKAKALGHRVSQRYLRSFQDKTTQREPDNPSAVTASDATVKPEY